MIHIEIPVQEAKLLHESLRRYVSDLGMEIADTDSLDFREGLKAEREALRKVLEQLSRALGGGSV